MKTSCPLFRWKAWAGAKRTMALSLLVSVQLLQPDFASAQSFQTVNMAIPAKSFQMVIYPVAQQKGYMKEEGLDQRVIFIAPTTSIQAMLGGGFDAAILSVEQRYVALDKGMREMFFMGNEVKNSWGTLATTDKLIKENPKIVGGFVRATIKALRYLRQEKEGAISAMLKFSGVSRQQATRVYDDIIGTFTRNGVVDDETQRNDLNIIRQVTNTNETMPNAKAYDFSFAQQADQQLNKAGWRPCF